MSDTIVLDGTCKLVTTLDGSVQLQQMLDGSAMAVLVSKDFDYYQGTYEVKPLADAPVVLPTMGLMMADDVTVQKVPYYEVSNIFGDTVYIASEVEQNGN